MAFSVLPLIAVGFNTWAQSGMIVLTAVIFIELQQMRQGKGDVVNIARRTGTLVVIEAIGWVVFLPLILLGGLWLELVFTIPVIAWNVYKIVSRQWYVDPTKAYDSKIMNWLQIEYGAKAGFYVLLFIACIVRMIVGIVTGSF